MVLACASVGCVLVNLNWRQPEGTLRQLVASLGCTLLLVGAGFGMAARRIGGGELPLLLDERALRHRIVERHPVLLEAVKLLQLAQPHGREVLELDARVHESLALLVGQRVLGVIRRPRPHPREPHRQG